MRQPAELRRQLARAAVAGHGAGVAHQPVAAGAHQRRAGEAGGQVGVGAQRQQRRQRLRVACAPREQIRFRGSLGADRPGAHFLAQVAAEQPGADRRSQCFRYGTAVFDGEVGDAAPRVELVGGDDRPRRAHVDAIGAAAPAALGGRPGRLLDRQRGQQLSDEEPASPGAIDRQRVLAAKAHPGRRRVVGFQQGGGVRAGAEAVLRKLFRQAARHRAQPRAQQLVVVAPPGVLRDAARSLARRRAASRAARRRRISAAPAPARGLIVAEGRRQHRPAAGQQRLRVYLEWRVPLQVGHRPVPSRRQPRAIGALRLRVALRRRHPARRQPVPRAQPRDGRERHLGARRHAYEGAYSGRIGENTSTNSLSSSISAAWYSLGPKK